MTGAPPSNHTAPADDTDAPPRAPPSPAPPLTVRAVRGLLGSRAVGLATVAVVTAVAMGGVELLLASCLQLFLVAAGVAPADLLPPWARQAGVWGVGPVTALLLVVGLARSLGMFGQAHLAHAAGELTLGRVRGAVIHAQLFPPDVVPDARSLANTRYHDMATKVHAWVLSAVLLVAALVQGAAILAALVVLSPALAGAAAALLGLGALVIHQVQARVRTMAPVLPELARQQGSAWERVLRNRLFISLVRLERQEELRLISGVGRMQRHGLRQLAVQHAVGSGVPFLGVVILVTVVVLGVDVLGVAGMPLLAFLYLLFRLVGQAQAAAGTAVAIQIYLPQVQAALALWARLDERARTDVAAALGKAPLLGSVVARAPGGVQTAAPLRAGDAAPPTVELLDVDFGYDGGPLVVKGFSLTVPKGGQVGLVGPSGVGKSTLLLLVLGVLKPGRGAVLVNGMTPEAWRTSSAARLGYVGPEPFVVHGSVAENLRYGGDPNASDAALLAALREAHLEALATPEGLARVVTEEAEGLSAGQKQRLCLARALLVNPDLLILDEATANVDDETERLIADSLKHRKGRCTTVVVTHRRGLLVHADAVVELAAV